MWKLSVEGLAQGLALVVVCAPATPYLLPRARFCVSAAHTIPQLQGVLDKLAKFGERFDILFRKHEPCRTDPAYYKWLREAPLEVRIFDFSAAGAGSESLGDGEMQDCRNILHGPGSCGRRTFEYLKLCPQFF